MLDQNQRTRLLQIARDSIQAVFERRRPVIDPQQFDEELRRPAGAFVTLEKDGELRGCIGSIHAVAPLVEAVSRSAVNAAFRDPRFSPVGNEELPELHIEISVMSPIVEVEDVGEIEVGRDGLIISKGPNAGLLLPQVAIEYGWDRDTFLGQTCLKAGLPADTWKKPGCKIERFSAEVFGE
jgi:AmmeMemoRadiSam system protein A